ncbi:MAG TPA: hypothetical protein V6D09_23920 [Leptolyngbyaceae cyanobacterium]
MKWERENFWIYGAIEPLTGEHFLHEYPQLNGDYFQEFLDWLSQQLGGDYAILQIDSDPDHISSAIRPAGKLNSSAWATSLPLPCPN